MAAVYQAFIPEKTPAIPALGPWHATHCRVPYEYVM
jgi:hypothetical protein